MFRPHSAPPHARFARAALVCLTSALAAGCSLGVDLDTSAVQDVRCAHHSDCPADSVCTSHGFCGQQALPADTLDSDDSADGTDGTLDTLDPSDSADAPLDSDDTAADGDNGCSGTLCDGACVDTQSSSAHCGACDAACAEHLSCIDGACRCQAPLNECARACVDMRSNESHCGSCGIACGDDATCIDGVCRCADDAGEVCEDSSQTVISARCSGQNCVLTCALGRSDCNDDSTDGCETELLCP